MAIFYFAWVDEGTAFSAVLEVEDEKIIGFDIAHTEGEFPTLAVDVRNPKTGLLNPGRKTWAWFSWDEGGTDGTQPLFYGRLVGIPEHIQDDVVRLTFIARPDDWDAQREALAATLKVAPYWDPVWIEADRREDPDAVLEARSALWHVDRVTHEVTISDIAAGEAGLLDVADGHFYDSLDITYGQAPVRAVRCEADVFWDQAAIGELDLRNEMLAAFATAGTTKNQAITSFTGRGLMEDWPSRGTRIGGGWEVGDSDIMRTDGWVVPVDYVEKVYAADARRGRFPLWVMNPTFNVAYDVSRRFSERVVFTLEADCQALLTEPGEEEVLLVTLASDEVGYPIDPPDTDNPDGVIPIGDVRRRTYFQTDRGHQSFEYLIALCRSRLVMRARAAKKTSDVPFETGVDLSCRHSIRLADDRIPGGEAIGKVIGYRLIMNGDSGQFECEIRIGCMVGTGDIVTEVAGTPSYVEDGYVDGGYQVRIDAWNMPIADIVLYENYDGTPINDDGVDFMDLRAAQVVNELTVINGETAQRAILSAFQVDIYRTLTALNEVYTEVYLDLKPIKTGPWETQYEVATSLLMIPKTIDLEAV